MANTYLITYPNGSQVTARGVSITTNTVSTQVPPNLPAVFTVRAIQPAFGTQPYNPNAYVNQALSYQVPTIRYAPYFSSGYCQIWIRIYNANGTSYEISSSTSAIYVCGSANMTPGYTTVTRCDVLVTDSSGNILTIQGINGIGCPTWTATPDGECSATEIKCDCASDPRGFICIPCDTLNSKIRSLMLT
jgi:hypothetical protein